MFGGVRGGGPDLMKRYGPRLHLRTCAYGLCHGQAFQYDYVIILAINLLIHCKTNLQNILTSLRDGKKGIILHAINCEHWKTHHIIILEIYPLFSEPLFSAVLTDSLSRLYVRGKHYFM